MQDDKRRYIYRVSAAPHLLYHIFEFVLVSEGRHERTRGSRTVGPHFTAKLLSRLMVPIAVSMICIMGSQSTSGTVSVLHP